jgi:CCR4-NOT transcription complex subunit 1
MYVNLLAAVVRVLQANRNSMSTENREILDKVNSIYQQMLPRFEAAEEPATDAAAFPRDVEDEVVSFYESIYQGDLSIPQVVDHMKHLQNSSNVRDQTVFKCMIHNLFDEYRFFSRYPDRELLITSVLFGVLIQNQVFTSVPLGIALRYVLDALRQPAGSKLFRFGVNALAHFQERLTEWPQYCALLLEIDYLHQALPEVVRLINSIHPHPNVSTNNQAAPGNPNPQPNSHTETRLFSSLNVDGIIPDGFLQMETPNESIQDRVLFTINNITIANMDEKVAEIAGVLHPEHLRWFCNYIVVKRVSIEPNFHSLYVSFLEKLDFKRIFPSLLYETLCSISLLMNSESTLSSTQERSSLKNLGSWLGNITLAKNKPIKHINIAFKELLAEGYEFKRLLVVIPFVCKVLEQCANSSVFNPPNPWLMAIMRVLAELYHFAELKLNLKFEIEVLCKSLKLDINGMIFLT